MEGLGLTWVECVGVVGDVVVGDTAVAVRTSSHRSVHRTRSGRVVPVPMPARLIEGTAAAGDEGDRIRWGGPLADTIHRMWTFDVPCTRQWCLDSRPRWCVWRW